MSVDRGDELAPVRRLFEGINAGAIDAALSELSPDVTWSRPPDVPVTGTLRGRASVGEMWREFSRSLEAFEIVPTRQSQRGDRVLVHITFKGRTRSGDDFEFSGAQVFTLRAGEITEVREFRALPDARADLESPGHPG